MLLDSLYSTRVAVYQAHERPSDAVSRFLLVVCSDRVVWVRNPVRPIMILASEAVRAYIGAYQKCRSGAVGFG